MRAGWIVGADGPRSLVREHLGATFDGGEGGRKNVNVTFRAPALAARIPHPHSIHYWVLNPAQPGVVGPLDLDGTFWAIANGVESVADDAEAAAIVRTLLGDPALDVEVVATDPWQARLQLASSYAHDRAAIVGDACHQNRRGAVTGSTPGVGDALNLGWRLAAVARGWAPASFLATYTSERRPIGQRTIDVAAANMATLANELADPALMREGTAFEAARERAAAAIQATKPAEFHSLGLVLGAGYGPDAAAQSPTDSVYLPILAPGNRLPHLWLADGRSLYDLLGTGFTVFGTGAAAEALGAARSAPGMPLTLVDPVPLGLAEHFGGRTVLVRPDEHVEAVE